MSASFLPRGLCGLPQPQRHQLQVGAEHLCALGPRAVAEVLLQVADLGVDRAELLELLGGLRRRLSPAMVVAADANRMPPVGLRRVA